MTSIRQARKVGMIRRLTDAHFRSLMDRCAELRTHPLRTLVTQQGAPVRESLMLTRGMIGRYVAARDREVRQMVAIEVPGDFVDLHGFPVGLLDHDVVALTEIEVAVFPHERLREVVEVDPDLTVALWGLTIVDAAIHRHWSFRVGALRALASVANFLCEMEFRLHLAGEARDGSFRLPLTQADIGKACGMTPVHVSRMLRDLREAGFATVEGGVVTVHDREKLREVGQFDPQFLHLSGLGGPIPG